MLCTGDCPEWGPPPDTILSMPPPPLPGFESPPWAYNETAAPQTSHCGASLLCEIVSGSGLSEYSDLPRRGPSLTDDTWLLVLVSSLIGVLLLGTVLALFFMKFRDTVIGVKQTKSAVPTLPSKTRHLPSDANRATINRPINENRALWAAMTPRGTKHFISVDYPQIFVSESQQEDVKPVANYHPEEPKYETVVTGDLDGKPKGLYCAGKQASFDNSGFVDFGAEYEEPRFYGVYQQSGHRPSSRTSNHSIRSGNYQPNIYQDHQPISPYYDTYYRSSQYQLDENDTYAEPVFVNNALNRQSLPRPLVSSPTRIENPNLPPLNRYPRQSPVPSYTMRRSSTAKRYMMETGSLGRNH